MKILIADKFGPELPKLLAPFGEVFVADDAVVPDADVILVRSKTKVKGDYLARAANLKLVIRGGVGIDNIDVAACRARGILVRNTPEASAIAVAEMAFALMLAAVRHIPAADKGTKEGAFPKQLEGTELYGKVLGLFGFGNIGREVTKRALAFGMQVLVHDPFLAESVITETGARAVTRDYLLAQADILSLHVPLTPETRGLVNAATIESMKTGAIIVNTARGACIVDADLVAALASGKLRAAALDVYAEEPPPADSPLLTAKNVVLAPHLGASTKENMTRIGEIATRLIAEFAAGTLK